MPEGLAAELAEKHNDWHRSVAGLRALIGVRLVNQALKQLEK